MLYHNAGDGTFDVSPFADSVSLPESRSGGAVWADYNNDGWKDLYVLNQGANTLFRNDGTGFTDVTATAGVGDSGKGSSATWGDYDGDSFLDLYVVNWSCHPECDPVDLALAEDRLYHNNGDGTFTDVSSQLIKEKLQGAGFTASFGDFDDDGDPDLYVVNDALMNPIGNVYWRNDGPDTTGSCSSWCWSDASAETGAGTVVEGMGLAVGDYDNDLDLDFYYSNMVNPSELLQNQGQGTFTDVAEAAGVDTINGATVGWGASFFDYDNDGWLDLFMATTEFRRSDPNQPPDGMHFGHPNLLYHNTGKNDGNGEAGAPAFTNVTPATWYEVPRSSMGIAYADYDHDGRIDFVTGDWNQGYVLYRNVSKAGAEHNWFAAHLVGDGPVNRDAAGARLYLTDSNGKTQLREVRIGSSLGAGEETDLYFGLGTATIAEASVVWPDGTSVTFAELPVNERWYLTYPDREGMMNVAVEPPAFAQPTVASTATPTSVPTVSVPTVSVPMPLATATAVVEAIPAILPTPTAQVSAQDPPPLSAPVPTAQTNGMATVTTAPYPTVVDDDALLATAWFDLYLELVETTPGFTPPVAARAIGYGGVTLYEALVPGLPGYQSLVGQLNGLTSLPTPQPELRYHWPTVANSAMANITRMLFTNTTTANKSAIALLELQLTERYRPLLDAATFNRSTQYGRAVAVAIYGWSVTDGGHEGELHNFPDGHTPPVGSGLWESTPPGYAAALQPYWGNNRPMALRLDHGCVAVPPTPYSEDPNSAFYALAQEVYDTVRLLTPEQHIIARFWADDPGTTPTPPGHSLSVTTQLLRQTDASLALAAETYARVGIALNDAFIGCWQTKYQYNRIRPITFIHRQIDPTWNDPDVTDPVITPPFPEYTSGHSVQSGAVAEVLTSLFGTVTFTDHTHTSRGLLPRTYRSFWAMANEAAISRLYGGIHYRDAIEEGLVQGQCIGQQVVALQFHAK
ncbi:MAG: FG-GAP-like repeat-containing protein [Caldilineaceae bacterium]